jgi:hypothetical protein
MTFRSQPELAVIFKAAEARHLDPDQLARYTELTDARDRATAAQEVREHEGRVVKEVVTSVFKRYPYEEHHDNAMAKCIRDVRYVSAYSTMAMLMDDVQWLDDKLLIWLKTILQSFEFPAAATRKRALFAARAQDPALERLDGKRQSIHETYTRLRDGYEAVLTPNSFALMKPALDRVVDTLTED